MTERFYNPVIKYTTDSLKALPGSKLYFYENGTTTLKPIYADPFKNDVLPNPLEADYAGIFVPVFLDGTYRVELKNAAGVTQSGWPVDNYGGEGSGGAFAGWSAIITYNIGDFVTGSNGLRYVSTANNNLNNDPTIPANVPDYWEEVRLDNFYNPISNYLQYERVIYTDGLIYVSLQNGNIGNTPSAVSVWWEPEWRRSPSLVANYLSGGGNLSAYRNNVLTDGSTYTLPLAASVPANTILAVSMLDTHKGFQPLVQRAGADLLRRAAGTDTAMLMQQGQKVSFTLVSNGVDEWRI